ncbi:MAG TPA: FtsX-like permease family protein [Pyrinomonadaceae bacterium]|nr:FtsX-like permease family protein [Pyrinomonadaceae bacterium]
MSTLWRKAIRDFWYERARTILVILAIALGIAAFAAVMSSYAILTRELDRGYLETNPASAVLRVDAIDDELVAAVLQNPEVSNAEPSRTISGQIRTGPMQWRNLRLFVVKDYGNIRVNKLVPEKGAWPPATGEILVERDAFQVARANIGDAVVVKTADGVEQPLVISGRVHDVGQAQARMENLVYAYTNLDTLVQLGEKPYYDRLNILVAENRFDADHIRKVAADVKSLIESRGHEVWRVDVPPPGKHPHSELMGMLLLAMSSFGLFVLVLSGILVVNLLTAMMASQVRQIGVMKAIGGTRWQIARIYFSQALFLGIAAVIVALPLGLLGSRALCEYMAVFLNFNINSFAVPVWVYLLVALVGIAAPLAAAAFPVWKGSGAPVRVALADVGLTQRNFGASWFDRALARIGGSFRPLLLAIRNSFRRRARLALTLATLAAGGLFFLAALNVRASMINTLDRLFATRKFDLAVILRQTYDEEQVQRAIVDVPGVRRGEAWLAADASLDGRDFTVIGLPADGQLLEPQIVEGRNLLPSDSDAIVINTALARRFAQMRVGATVNVQVEALEKSFRVVGVAREEFSPAIGYVPLTAIQPPRVVNSLRFALDQTDEDSLATVKAEIDRRLERQDIRARSSTSKADTRFGYDQHMVMIYIFLIVMSAIIGCVGGLGLMTTMSLNVLERRREMGVLRAIGATPRVVWLVVIAEGLVIGVLSWAIAVVLAWPVSKFVGDSLIGMMFRSGLDFTFEPIGIVIWLLVTVALSAVASFVPAWRASRATVREALAYE